MKHISFYDSPVMRELERQAIKNKTFDTNSVADIVKMAAATKKPIAPTPSKDLYRDMINLAVALKKKGFEKEAESLEDKIFLYKQAETHLYRAIDEDAEDVINFAHPDGDHKVSDAQDQNGEVETTLSAHQKILQVVNKKPTGKFAKLVDNLILATAEVLDVDLMKMAAPPLPKGKAKGTLTPEDQEDLAQEQYELESPDDTKKKIGEVNANIKSGLDNFSQYIQAASAATGIGEGNVSDWMIFDPLKIMQGQGLDYYAKKTGVNKDNITNYWNLHQSIYGANTMTPDSVSRLIWNLNDYSKVLDFFRKRLPEKVGYFEGSKLTDVNQGEWAQVNQNVARGDTRWKNNPNSVWISNANWGADDFDWFKLEPGSVTAAATDINQTLIGKYNQLFSADKLTKAVEGVKGDAGELLNSLKYLLESVSEVPAVRRTVGLVVGKLQSMIKNTNIAIKQYQVALPAYNALGASGPAGSILSNLEAAAKVLLNLIPTLQQLKLDPVLDNPVSPELFNSIAGKFKRVAITLRNYLASETDKTQEDIDTAKENFNSARNIYSLLSSSKDTPWAHLRSQIASSFPSATTPQELDKVANEGLEMSKQYEAPGVQKADDGLTSTAQWKTPGTPGVKPATPVKPGTAPAKPVAPGTQPAQQPGMKKLDTTKPDRIAVANMQLALNNLGRGISIDENKAKFPKVTDYKAGDGLTMIGTGPKSNPHINMFDGAWGPSTETALQLAQKYLGSLGLTLRTGQRWDYSVKSHKPDTEEAAKFNTGAINRANAMLGTLTDGTGANTANKVYDKLPPTISSETIMSDETLGATIPITGKDLSSLGSLFTFLERNNVSVKAPAPGERNSDEIGLTFNEWSYLLYWLRQRAKYLYDKGTDKELKREYFNSISTLMGRLTNIGQQLGVKDTFGGGVVVPSSLLTGGAQGAGTGSTYNRHNFLPQSPEQRRGRGAGGGMEGSRTRTTTSGEDTSPPFDDIIDLRKEWYNLPFEDLEIAPVLRLEDFQRVPGARMAQGMFGGNTIQYQQFLNSLWQQIKSAFASWSRDASSDEITAIQNYYNRWQQGLSKQYRDITSRR